MSKGEAWCLLLAGGDEINHRRVAQLGLPPRYSQVFVSYQLPNSRYHFQRRSVTIAMIKKNPLGRDLTKLPGKMVAALHHNDTPFPSDALRCDAVHAALPGLPQLAYVCPLIFCFTDPARACFGFHCNPQSFPVTASPHQLACAIHINKDAYRLLKPPFSFPCGQRRLVVYYSAGDIKLYKSCAALTLATLLCCFCVGGFHLVSALARLTRHQLSLADSRSYPCLPE